MGFEQLAELKKRLAKEAKEAKEAKAARGAKEAKRQAAKPARPAQPARPKASGRPEAKGETVDPVVRSIGKLQKRFPAAFPKNPAPKVPLKIGVLADLLAHSEELGLNEAEIREALGTWCRGSRYWACLTDGAARVDLSGAPAGQVTARDATFARNQAKGAQNARRRGPRAAAPDNAATAQPSPPDSDPAPDAPDAAGATPAFDAS